jgi:hypothetical protein
MANLDTAVDRAGKVKGPEQAARMYADVDTELGLGDYTEDQAGQGEQALAILEQRYPGVRSRSHEKVEAGHLPQLSRSAKDKLAAGDDEPVLGAQTKREHAARKRRPNRTVRQRFGSATTIHARPRRRSSSLTRTVYRGTGAQGANESISQLLLKSLGGLAGLSFAYLLLSPRGVSAVQFGSNGVEDVLNALISPGVDPLRATKTAIENSGFAGTQKATSSAAAANPNVFDTPTGTAPYTPPTFGNPAGGTFDTPGGVAPFKPPTRLAGGL